MPFYVSTAILFAAAVPALLIAGPLQAQSDEPGMADVLRELQELREENRQMRGEIDELHSMNDDGWLTERRAEEIQGLVYDVLADADTRAGLQGNGMTAGWDRHFFIASHDGRFRLQLDGQIQARWVYNFRDEQADRHVHGFENTRTKLTFRGHVFNPDWTYLVRGSFGRNGGAFTLQDAFIRLNLNDNWSVRFGQFKLPFNREELIDSKYTQGVERSLVNEQVNIGRSQGIELTWEDIDDRFSIALSDGGTDNVGVMGFTTGTMPQNSTALVTDSEYTFTARYEKLFAGTWDQFTDMTSPMRDEFGLMVGVAGHYQKDERTGAPSTFPLFLRDEIRWAAFTTDVSAEFGGANLFASFTDSYFDSAMLNLHTMAVVIQGGVYFLPKWEAFARFEYGWFDAANNNIPDLNLVTGGVNYYIDGHDVKWTTDIGFATSQVAGLWTRYLAGYRQEGNDHNAPQIVFRTQFQMLF